MKRSSMMRVTVVGAGAWGTALAKHLAEKQLAVSLWAHEPEVVHSIAQQRENALYLPGVRLPATLTATNGLSEALTQTDCVLFAVPSHVARPVLGRIGPLLPEQTDLNLMGDEKKIRQVFINFLSNAIKFTGENGIIEINLKEINGFAEISFKDNGVGISLEHQKFIFDKFYQVGQVMYSENEGTGLGLSICKHIIENHGGVILLDSTPGKGSKFTIRLPL